MICCGLCKGQTNLQFGFYYLLPPYYLFPISIKMHLIVEVGKPVEIILYNAFEISSSNGVTLLSHNSLKTEIVTEAMFNELCIIIILKQFPKIWVRLLQRNLQLSLFPHFLCSCIYFPIFSSHFCTKLKLSSCIKELSWSK